MDDSPQVLTHKTWIISQRKIYIINTNLKMSDQDC